MRRIPYITAILVIICGIAGIRIGYAQTQPQPVANQAESSKDCETIKKEYEALRIDRDNLFIQSRKLLEFKSKALEVDRITKESQEALDKLKNDLNARMEQNSLLQQKIGELEQSNAQLLQDKEILKNSLEKVEIEYRIVPETRKEISRLKQENTSLLREKNELAKKLGAFNDYKLDADAQVEIYRRQLKDVKKQYDVALEKNRVLEKKANEAPVRLAELARENKVLIKETALMHYNLGVFYTQNKEYPRAVAEFEKAVELNADDAYAYYNLGYIYAEYVVDRPKAIEYFRKFLKLTKSEDKDVDWVKKYILTWQTWEGKKPVQ